MELAKLMISVKRWDEAKEVLERVIGRLQALQMTAKTVGKIGKCDKMLREMSELIDARR